MQAIANVLDVPLGWLATGEGVPLRDTEVLADRPLYLIDGAATPGGGGSLADWRGPEAEVQDTVRTEFYRRFHKTPGPPRSRWADMNPTVRLLFGNCFARHLEHAKRRTRTYGGTAGGWTVKDARKRGDLAASLWKEVAKEARTLDPQPPSGPYRGPAWTDAFVRAIGERMARERV